MKGFPFDFNKFCRRFEEELARIQGAPAISEIDHQRWVGRWTQRQRRQAGIPDSPTENCLEVQGVV